MTRPPTKRHTTAPPRVEPKWSPDARIVLVPMLAGLLSLVAGGSGVVAVSIAGGGSWWQNLAVLHLTAVSGLLTIALSAMIQLSPVTTGTSYRLPGLQTAGTLLVWFAGLLLATGFFAAQPQVLMLGGVAAATGIIAALTCPFLMVVRSRPFTPLHLGIVLAAVGFTAAALLGFTLAGNLAGAFEVPAWLPVVHVASALGLGFLALLYGVSWQLLGMFAGAPYPQAWQGFGLVIGVAAAAVLSFLPLGSDVLRLVPVTLVSVASAVHISQRVLMAPPVRRRRHVSLAALAWSWQVALAPAAAMTALAIGHTPPIADLLVLVLVGGVVLAVFSFLQHILPFLIWLSLQRQALRGERVPKVNEILPERGGLAGLLLLEVGVVAVFLSQPVGLVISGLAMVFLALRLILTGVRFRSAISGRGGRPRAV